MIPPGPKALILLLFASSASGLVWSMNWESCDEAKNSLIALASGLILIKDFGVISFVSPVVTVIFEVIFLAILVKPILNWVWINSPTARILLLLKLSISSTDPKPSIKFMK